MTAAESSNMPSNERHTALSPLLVLVFAAFLSFPVLAESPGLIETQTTFRANSLTFDAAMTRPADGQGNGWAVLLLGGGLAHDLDWRTPPAFAFDPDAPGDAAIIADALAACGFTVLRWSTLAREDPLREQYPDRATPRSHDDLLAQAHAALDLLEKESAMDARRLLVVGHSLGALRALHLASADERVAGVALLAGARLSRVAESRDAEAALRLEVEQIIERADINEDERIDAEEAAAVGAPSWLRHHDVDRDGYLQEWEVLASYAIARREAAGVQHVANSADAGMLPWAEDLAIPSHVAIACIGGGADHSQAHQGPLFAHRLGSNRVRLHMIAGLGHTLAREADGRVSPIAPEAIDLLTRWATEIARAGTKNPG